LLILKEWRRIYYSPTVKPRPPHSAAQSIIICCGTQHAAERAEAEYDSLL